MGTRSEGRYFRPLTTKRPTPSAAVTWVMWWRRRKATWRTGPRQANPAIGDYSCDHVNSESLGDTNVSSRLHILTLRAHRRAGISRPTQWSSPNILTIESAEHVVPQQFLQYDAYMCSMRRSGTEQIDSTCALIDTLSDLDVSDIPSTVVGELTLQISRAVEQLTALRSELLSRADANGDGFAAGYSNTTSWLSIRTGATHNACQQAVHNARALRTLPLTAAAWRAGDVTTSHVTLICRAASRVDEFAEHEALFVGYAKELSARQLRVALDRFIALMRPDDANRDFNRQHNARSLSISTTLDGMVKLDGLFDPVAGQTIINAINSLMSADPTIHATRRRADALTELCAAWAAGDVTGGTERPQLLVTCTIDQLAGTPGAELSPGQYPLSPISLRHQSCDAAIIRVVTNATGDPIDVGRATRTIPPALRRALIVRDGGCVFPGCERPHGWCEAHHLRHWSNGGATNLANTGLLCSRHHHLVHQHHWTLARQSDGTWTLADHLGNDITWHYTRWHSVEHTTERSAIEHCAGHQASGIDCEFVAPTSKSFAPALAV
jgi:Domain of unknown function (DUF222)